MDSASLLDGDIVDTCVYLGNKIGPVYSELYTINSDAGSAQLPPTGNLGSTMVICSEH